MLPKSQISLITSLQYKKFRGHHHLFVVEGLKSVVEFCSSPLIPQTIYHTPAFGAKMLKLSKNINIQEISISDMARISLLKTPPGILALVPVPPSTIPANQLLKGKFTLALDGIQDPGNMGTIIRTADWFGIKHIICSEDTVDVYNPKVVQATMGSLSRVSIYYGNLKEILTNSQLPLFGALLNGENIYSTDFGSEGILVMGNEANGISEEICKLVEKPITIPQAGGAESLNVAIATAIFCSELSRNSLK